jgi:hypothetical protein
MLKKLAEAKARRGGVLLANVQRLVDLVESLLSREDRANVEAGQILLNASHKLMKTLGNFRESTYSG